MRSCIGILESIDPPWLKREAVGQFRVHDPFDLIAGRKSLDFNLIEAGFSPQSIFGYFSLAAIISEMDRNDEKEKPDPQRIKQCFPQPISTIIVSRSGRDVEADSAIAGCKFSPRQQSIVTGWARREINLLG